MPLVLAVPDTVRLLGPGLFTPRLRQVLWCVLGSYDKDQVPARLSGAGHVTAKRSVAPLMAADQLPVRPDRRRIIDGAKVDDDTLGAEVARHADIAPVPKDLVEPGVVYRPRHSIPVGRARGSCG